jgi:uncharacterized SAM-dependent methyltransferase
VHAAIQWYARCIVPAGMPPFVSSPPSSGVLSRSPGAGALEAAWIAGLRERPKRLSLRQDEVEPELFARACGQPEHYPRECELRLIDAHGRAIAREVGPGAHLLATSDGIEARRVLAALRDPAGKLHVDLRGPVPAFARTLLYVSGCRFDDDEPAAALARLARLARPGTMMLFSADSTHERAIVERAYDDEAGLWAELSLRALARHGGVEPDGFVHQAVWNEVHSCVELRLISRRTQIVRAEASAAIEIAAGESIVTRTIYKHPPHTMRAMLVAAGWEPVSVHASRVREVRLWLCRTR